MNFKNSFSSIFVKGDSLMFRRFACLLLSAGCAFAATNVDSVFARFASVSSGIRDLSYHSSTRTGFMGQENEILSDIQLKYPDKLIQTVSMGGKPVRTAVNGSQVYMTDPATGNMKVLKSGGSIAANLMSYHFPSARIATWKTGYSFTVLSDNGDTIVLKGTLAQATTPGGIQSIDLFFLKSTGLLVGFVGYDPAGTQMLQGKQWFANVSNIWVLQKIRIDMMNNGKAVWSEITNSEIRVNQGLRDDVFQFTGANK